MPADAEEYLTLEQHRRELQAVTGRYAAMLQMRLERFVQQLSKQTPAHLTTVAELDQGAGIDRAASPTLPSRGSPKKRLAVEEVLRTRVNEPMRPADVRAGTGRSSATPAEPTSQNSRKNTPKQITAAAKSIASANSGSTAAVMESAEPCPILLMHQDLVLREAYDRPSRKARQQQQPGQPPQRPERDTSLAINGPMAPAVEMVAATPAQASAAAAAADDHTGTLATPLIVLEASPSDHAWAPAFDTPSAGMVVAPEDNPGSESPQSQLPQPGFRPVKPAAGSSLAAPGARPMRSRQVSIMSTMPGGVFQQAGAGLLGAEAKSRRGSTASAFGMSRAASFSAFGDDDAAQGDDASGKNPLQLEVERLAALVNGRTQAVMKLQKEAAAVGVTQPALEAAVRGQAIEPFLADLQARTDRRRERANGGRPSVLSALASAPIAEDGLSRPFSRPDSPETGSTSAQNTSPGTGVLETPGTRSSLGPTPRANARRASRMAASTRSSATGVARAASRVKSSAPPSLQLSPVAAEAFFDAFVRDSNAEELQRVTNELAEAVEELGPAAPAGFAAVAHRLAGDSVALLDYVAEERTTYAAAFKALERLLRKDRRDAEAAVDRLATRCDVLERQVVVLVRDHLVASGELMYPDDDDEDDFDPSGGVDRGEEVMNDDGVVVATSGLQCVLRPSDVDDALRTLRGIANKERLVHELIGTIEGLVHDVDRHDKTLEHEVSCQLCGEVSDDYYALWPCGHGFCGSCTYNTAQNDRGEFTCPTCYHASSETPVHNLTANMIAARIGVKRIGSGNLLQSLNAFRELVDQIDATFRRDTDAHYRLLANDDDEFRSFRDTVRQRRQ